MIPIGDSEKTNRPPWVNMTLILINVGVFIYVFFFSGAPLHIIKRFGFVPANFFHTGWNPLIYWAKYIPLFTAHFMHADIFHILGNMLFLTVFGDNVEDKLGHVRYFIFYMVCGIISLLVQGYAFKNSTLTVAGASGAIAGIMGAFYILYPHAKVKSWFIVITKDIPAVYYIFIWFLINLIRGLLHFEHIFIEPVAWWAHVGGFIAGAILINLFLIGAPQIKANIKVKPGGKPPR